MLTHTVLSKSSVFKAVRTTRGHTSLGKIPTTQPSTQLLSHNNNLNLCFLSPSRHDASSPRRCSSGVDDSNQKLYIFFNLKQQQQKNCATSKATSNIFCSFNGTALSEDLGLKNLAKFPSNSSASCHSPKSAECSSQSSEGIGTLDLEFSSNRKQKQQHPLGVLQILDTNLYATSRTTGLGVCKEASCPPSLLNSTQPLNPPPLA